MWRDATVPTKADFALTIFALPIVIVGGIEGAADDVTIAGILEESELLAAILREHRALDGNETFAFADALRERRRARLPALPEIFSVAALPEWRAAEFSPRIRRRLRSVFRQAAKACTCDFSWVPPSRRGARTCFHGRRRQMGHAIHEGTLAPTGQQSGIGARAGACAERPLPAFHAGRVAKREVGAQLFASNAIRKLRASVGEPTAVISAHRAPDVPGGGESRLSLSSPFAPRDAEGFRCPLHPLDRAGDVASMLAKLMTDCRVTDLRVVSGVHADRDPTTGLTLLFKPDALPVVH